jgi:hypothetical protein
MSDTEHAAKLDTRFSDPGAKAVPWAEAEQALTKAEIFWLSTVRRDGRPHVTPLVAAWHGGALYFCTGEGEQKYKNIAANPQVILTTGNNSFGHGSTSLSKVKRCVRRTKGR